MDFVKTLVMSKYQHGLDKFILLVKQEFEEAIHANTTFKTHNSNRK